METKTVTLLTTLFPNEVSESVLSLVGTRWPGLRSRQLDTWEIYMAIYLAPCTDPTGPAEIVFQRIVLNNVALKIDFGKVKLNKWCVFIKQTTINVYVFDCDSC